MAPGIAEFHKNGESREQFETDNVCDSDDDVPMPPVEDEGGVGLRGYLTLWSARPSSMLMIH